MKLPIPQVWLGRLGEEEKKKTPRPGRRGTGGPGQSNF